MASGTLLNQYRRMLPWNSSGYSTAWSQSWLIVYSGGGVHYASCFRFFTREEPLAFSSCFVFLIPAGNEGVGSPM
jgi:hypothetical protein